MFDQATVDQFRGIVRDEVRVAVRDEVRLVVREEVRVIVKEEVRSVVREEVRTIVREEVTTVVEPRFQQLDAKIEREIDALRCDMKAEFVASERRMIGVIGEMIEENVLPQLARAA